MPRMDTVYAIVTADSNGQEVIPYFMVNGEVSMALGLDMPSIEAFRDVISINKSFAGRKFTVVRFTSREDLEVIDRRRDTLLGKLAS